MWLLHLMRDIVSYLSTSCKSPPGTCSEVYKDVDL